MFKFLKLSFMLFISVPPCFAGQQSGGLPELLRATDLQSMEKVLIENHSFELIRNELAIKNLEIITLNSTVKSNNQPSSAKKSETKILSPNKIVVKDASNKLILIEKVSSIEESNVTDLQVEDNSITIEIDQNMKNSDKEEMQ